MANLKIRFIQVFCFVSSPIPPSAPSPLTLTSTQEVTATLRRVQEHSGKGAQCLRSHTAVGPLGLCPGPSAGAHDTAGPASPEPEAAGTHRSSWASRPPPAPAAEQGAGSWAPSSSALPVASPAGPASHTARGLPAGVWSWLVGWDSVWLYHLQAGCIWAINHLTYLSFLI